MSRILAAGRNLARSLSFAHLSGVTGARASDDDDGDTKDKKDAKADEGDDDDEEDTPPKKDKDAKAKSKAKAEDDDSEKDDDEDDKPKSKKAKSKADDEDPDASAEDDKDDDEMRGNSAAAAARRRERARCAAIFACQAAGSNTQLAAHLAFNTTMTRSEAIGALEAAPAPEPQRARGSHPDRSRANPNLSTNGGGQQPRSVQVAKSLDAAFAAVNPQRKR